VNFPIFLFSFFLFLFFLFFSFSFFIGKTKKKNERMNHSRIESGGIENDVIVFMFLFSVRFSLSIVNHRGLR